MITKKITLALMGFSAVSLVFIILVVYPLINGVRQASQELILQKAVLAEFEAKTRNLQNFKMVRNTNKDNLIKLEDLFIDSAEPIGFIEFLEDESFNSQLAIEIFPLAPEKNKEATWPSMNFNLKLLGPSSNFSKFFEKLEASPFLVEVLSFNLRGLNENDLRSQKFAKFFVGDIEANLFVKVYTRK
ncbi:MAG: hypothetical protein Q8O84_04130 [Nanoarchaeota archaeon]|nr:hypothetical protein [Nanoarchaeota archaeon]